MKDPYNRLTVVLEYSPRLKRAFVRAVLEFDESLPPLEPGNIQNHVGVFLGHDMLSHVGISPLVVER